MTLNLQLLGNIESAAKNESKVNEGIVSINESEVNGGVVDGFHNVVSQIFIFIF